MTEASVTVDSVRDDTLSVAVAGEIDMFNAPTVERQILESIPNHLAEVTVDLSALDYIDSAGLRLLLSLGTRLKTLQIDLVLVVPTDSLVRRMIDVAGVAEFIPIHSEQP